MPLHLTDTPPSFFSVAGLKVHYSQIAAAFMSAAFFYITFFLAVPFLLKALFFGSIFGTLLIVTRNGPLTKLIERFAQSVATKQKGSPSGGKLSFIMRAIYAIANAPGLVANNLRDPFVRAGVRLSLWVSSAILAFIVVMTIIYLIFLLLFMIFMFYVFKLMWFLMRVMGIVDDKTPESGKENKDDPGEPLSDEPRRQSSKRHNSLQPQAQFSLEQRNGKHHLIKKGIIDIDLGELKQRDQNTLETDNLLGINIRLTKNRDMFGNIDPRRPFHVSHVDDSKEIHRGDLTTGIFSNALEFESTDEDQ